MSEWPETLIPSPGPSRAENRFVAMVSLAICVFVLYIAIGIPLSNIWNIVRIRDLELNGQLMNASVGEYQECPAKRGKVACYEVSYQVNGKAYQSRNVRQDLKPHQAIQIIYAPIDPGFYRFADLPKPAPWHEGLGLRLLIIGVISIVFGTASLSALKRQLRVLKSMRETSVSDL